MLHVVTASNANHRRKASQTPGRSVFLVIRSGLNSDCSTEDDRAEVNRRTQKKEEKRIEGNGEKK